MLEDKGSSLDFLHILVPSSPCVGRALSPQASSDKISEAVLTQTLQFPLCSTQHFAHTLSPRVPHLCLLPVSHRLRASTPHVYPLHPWTGTLYKQFLHTYIIGLHWFLANSLKCVDSYLSKSMKACLPLNTSLLLPPPQGLTQGVCTGLRNCFPPS